MDGMMDGEGEEDVGEPRPKCHVDQCGNSAYFTCNMLMPCCGSVGCNKYFCEAHRYDLPTATKEIEEDMEVYGICTECEKRYKCKRGFCSFLSYTSVFTCFFSTLGIVLYIVFFSFSASTKTCYFNCDPK